LKTVFLLFGFLFIFHLKNHQNVCADPSAHLWAVYRRSFFLLASLVVAEFLSTGHESSIEVVSRIPDLFLSHCAPDRGLTQSMLTDRLLTTLHPELTGNNGFHEYSCGDAWPLCWLLDYRASRDPEDGTGFPM
jgi:hypothetical protein